MFTVKIHRKTSSQVMDLRVTECRPHRRRYRSRSLVEYLQKHAIGVASTAKMSLQRSGLWRWDALGRYLRRHRSYGCGVVDHLEKNASAGASVVRMPLQQSKWRLRVAPSNSKNEFSAAATSIPRRRGVSPNEHGKWSGSARISLRLCQLYLRDAPSKSTNGSAVAATSVARRRGVSPKEHGKWSGSARMSLQLRQLYL